MVNVDDQQRLQTLNEQLRQQQHQRYHPEDDNEIRRTAHCVKISRSQWTADGVISETWFCTNFSLIFSRSYCTQYDRPLAWYCRLSVCPPVSPYVTLCIVVLWLNETSYSKSVWTSDEKGSSLYYRNTTLQLSTHLTIADDNGYPTTGFGRESACVG